MNRSVSATDAALPSVAALLEPDQRQRRERGQHREAAVERIRHLRLRHTSAAAALRP